MLVWISTVHVLVWISTVHVLVRISTVRVLVWISTVPVLVWISTVHLYLVGCTLLVCYRVMLRLCVWEGVFSGGGLLSG